MSALQLRPAALSLAIALVAATATNAYAQKKYDTGATDTEIKIGNVEAYSGPASAYGVIGKTQEAYFKMIMIRAASMAARSTGSAMTMPIRHQRPLNRCAS